MTSISFCFPCYNDSATIGSLVWLVHRALESRTADFEVIVVNDGSEDDSRQVLDRLSGIFPSTLKVIHHPKNCGYGAALISGFRAATKEWVGYADGDGQFDVDEVRKMAPLLTDDFDWIQGFRNHRMDSWVRILVGATYRSAIRMLFHLKIWDIDCDFRFFRKSFVEPLALQETTGCITVELAKKLEILGARMLEVEVGHFHRLHGTSQFFGFTRVSRTLVRLLGLRRDLNRWSRDHDRRVLNLDEVWNDYRLKMNRTDSLVSESLQSTDGRP